MSLGRIGLGIGIEDDTEFNRRANLAFRGVRFHPDYDLPPNIAKYLREGTELTGCQQQLVYELAYRYRAQIVDQLVVDYAEDRQKGSDE